MLLNVKATHALLMKLLGSMGHGFEEFLIEGANTYCLQEPPLRSTIKNAIKNLSVTLQQCKKVITNCLLLYARALIRKCLELFNWYTDYLTRAY